MKNVKFKFLAAGFVLAMVFTFSCSGGGGDDGGSGSSKLTITGLPSGLYNVLVFAAGANTSFNNFDEDDCDAISPDGGNVFTLYDAKAVKQTERPVLWTGSGNREVILENYQPPSVWRATVNFSNGSATVPFSRFTLLGEVDIGGGSSSSGSSGGDPSGSWPSSSILSEHGVDGLNLPPGTSDVNYQRTVVAYGKQLTITCTTTANISYFDDYFTSNGWTFAMEQSTATVTVKTWQKSSQGQSLTAYYSKDSSDNSMSLWVVLSYETGETDDD